ncbi:MAG TPA: hypothetical protein DCG75_03570 [Bacteroidales bacterium]|nr:hypothetical protein [Bacteroidales bacterium]
MKILIQWILENWQTVLIPFLALILEFLLRAIPTLKDYSIVNLIVSFLDFLIKNKAKDEEGQKGVFKRVRATGKASKIKFVNNNIRFNNTNKII